MIMRIDPRLAVAPTTLDTGKAQTPGKTVPPANRSAAVVTLSEAGSAVAADVAEATPPAVAARLAQIRALLDRGEYPIDLDALATSIIEDDILRTGKRHP